MYLEKIRVSPEDTILVHFDEENCDVDRVTDFLRCLENIYPNNPIIPIVPKYGIERFETRADSTGNPYKIESSSTC